MNAASAADKKPMRGAVRILSDILIDLGEEARAGGAPLQNPDRRDNKAEATAKLGDVVDRLDERAFGFLLLMLALPCCLPFVYVLPQIVALPMLALAGQLAAGRRHPWLPAGLSNRTFSVSAFERVLNRSAKYIGWVESIAKPRWRPVTGHKGAQIVGALLLLPTASILVPLPSTNTVPGIGVAVASVGLIERDGVLVVLGLLIGFTWIALLIVAVFAGVEAAQLLKDWLAARL